MANDSYIDLTYLALLAFLVSGIVVVSEFPVTGYVVQTGEKAVQNTGSAIISAADKATNDLLYNARIYIYDAKGGPLKNSGTGQGEAVFTNLKAGVYSASATAAGYKAGRGTFRIVAGSETRLLITMVKIAKESTPAGTGSVKINVIDKATRGRLSAIVAMYGERGRLVESRQTANGVAGFSLGAGSYSFVVRAAGYRDKRDTFRIAGGARIETTVEMENMSTSPTAQPSSAGLARFRVIDRSTNQSVSGAKVYVYDARGQFVGRNETAQAGSGIVVFGSLRAGVYSAWTTASGYKAERTSSFRVAGNSESAVTVSLRK
ncbi:MAG: hypothetical protein HYX24_00790 [Candidatus Aenigmarchaeota archaeon]|nr:hypothetical protein [Candidatus Aenigmarchaeota archaeon]